MTSTDHRQHALPDTGLDMAGLARKRASEPLRPSSAQQPCDHGIFSDEAAQSDLIEMFQKPTNE